MYVFNQLLVFVLFAQAVMLLIWTREVPGLILGGGSDLVLQQSTLRQVHSLFQSEFYIECDLALLLSVSRILSFP